MLKPETLKFLKDREPNDSYLDDRYFENTKYVCSMDGSCAITPDDFIVQASQASDYYEGPDGDDEGIGHEERDEKTFLKLPDDYGKADANGFRYGADLPVDLIFINDDDTTDFMTMESECQIDWLTLPVYHNVDGMADVIEKMKKSGECEEVISTLHEIMAARGHNWNDVAGAGLWRIYDDTDESLPEGPNDPEALIHYIDRNKEAEHCEFIFNFNDGSKLTSIPYCIDDNWPRWIVGKPNDDAKPFTVFLPNGLGLNVQCDGEELD